MTHQQARRRFMTVLIVSMAVFLLASLGLAWAEKSQALPGFATWFLVIVPVVAFLTPLWAQWRYLDEIDEYLRSLELKAVFFGLVVVLLFASAWGYAEFYIEAPVVAMYWLNPVYWIAYSIGSMVLAYRERQQA